MYDDVEAESRRSDWSEPAQRRRASWNRRPMSRRRGNAFFWMFWLMAAAIIPAAFLIA